MAELATKYQQYAEYKDSGVEWLDVIPMHWVMSKIKYIAPFQVGWTPPTGNDSNFIGENIWANISDLRGKVITDTVKRISDKAAKEASMDITPKGSLLYSFKLSVGSVSFAGCDMYTNEAIASFTSDSLLPLEYLYYVLPKFLIENASTNIYGARILNQELIKNAIILKPTYEEAKTIANFLDHETAQIDTLIEKQQTLIKLLKEKRQAVISHAVTKGLNPDALMKDSGVEWLGEVPEHWTISKIKYLTYFQVGWTPPTKNDANFIGNNLWANISDLKEKTIVNTAKRISDRATAEASMDITPKGSLMYSFKLSVGTVSFAGCDMYTNEAIASFTDESLLPLSYLYFALPEFVIMNASTNIYGARILNQELIRNALLLAPTYQEAQEIAKSLEIQITKIDNIIQKQQQLMNFSNERRTALISAAVTGKIDVRGWVAPVIAI